MAGLLSQKTPRVSFRKLVAFTLSVVVMSTCSVVNGEQAGATSVSSPSANIANKEIGSSLRIGELLRSPEYELSSASDTQARCRKSPLTQEKFLDIVHAIIKQGDLTDKSFIENTLSIKFGPANGAYADRHSSKGGFYSASMPGGIEDTPILVISNIEAEDLLVDKNGKLVKSDEPDKTWKLDVSSSIGFGHLDRVGAVFSNCQYLTQKQLNARLKAIRRDYDKAGGLDSQLDKPVIKEVRGNSAVASWYMGKIAKNGDDFEVKAIFRTDSSDAVQNVEIIQRADKN